MGIDRDSFLLPRFRDRVINGTTKWLKLCITFRSAANILIMSGITNQQDAKCKNENKFKTLFYDTISTLFLQPCRVSLTHGHRKALM